ncbi:MAG: 30S ribosomal protein S20 [Chitinivibrionales bacterium]|nr:30S ribosomal protein S20 [Chitinivibrionales bacterium]MBD3358629.1 30S ribosomal protein S20 [Chitinivibrionales bacterium]
MPHHKSCKKRMVTNQKANIKNRMVRSQLRTAVKNVLTASDRESAGSLLTKAYSVIDKAAKKGIIHKSNAANKKSRIARAIQKMAS